MESVEKGAVISISIAGGIVICVLGAVIIYIFRELYCVDYYTNMTGSTRKKKKNKKRTKSDRSDCTVTTISVEPQTQTEKVAPGGRRITLPDTINI